MPSKSTSRKALCAFSCRLPRPTLGPAFDAAALAMDFRINIEARQAGEFSIVATGRDARFAAISRITSFSIPTGK